jgi:hypothetical protein
MKTLSIEYALLSIQSALLGEVTPELRAVILDLDQDNVLLHAYFYHDGEASEKHLDIWSCVISEGSVDLEPEFLTKAKIEQLDYPQEIPSKGYFAYLRKEERGLQLKKNSLSKLEIKEMSLAYAMLAVQHALLGVVTPELRAVIVDFDKEKILLYIHFYYDKEVSKSLIDLWLTAIAEIRTDFAPNSLLDHGVERVDYPFVFPFRGRYAYRRKE